MGGLGGADGQPGHHSPNIGGSVSPKRTITEANGKPMPTVAHSSISHQKLDSVRARKTTRSAHRSWTQRVQQSCMIRTREPCVELAAVPQAHEKRRLEGLPGPAEASAARQMPCRMSGDSS